MLPGAAMREAAVHAHLHKLLFSYFRAACSWLQTCSDGCSVAGWLTNVRALGLTGCLDSVLLLLCGVFFVGCGYGYGVF